MIREPIVSGKFYPSDPEVLKTSISSFLREKQRKNVKGAVSPHAGYTFSGAVAGEVFSAVNIPDSIIVIGPNHQGLGGFFSLSGADSWKTPLGEIEVDKKLTDKILKYTPFIKIDDTSHMYEHSIEVQLPFIQYLNPSAKIVPISVMGYNYDEVVTVSKGISKAIEEYDEKVLVIASSDFSHYVPHEIAKKEDKLAIDKILKLDSGALWKTVKERHISMCGMAPVVMMIEITKNLGATQGELLKYRTSGEVSGDYESVVGYSAIIIY